MKKKFWLFDKLINKFVQSFLLLTMIRIIGVLFVLFILPVSVLQAQPANDGIGAAQVITINNYCSADAGFTTIGATSDGVAPSCWNTAPDRNVWFTFQATTNEVNVTIKRGGIYGTVRRINVAILESDGTTGVACKRYIGDNDDVTLGTTNLVPGNWYYISVDNNYAPYAGTFTICADDEVDYDFIEGAIEISDISNWCSADAEYTTYGATAVIGETQPSCWNTNPDYNRWFMFTATTNMVNITVKRGPTGTIRRINAAIWESDGTTPVSCNRYVNDLDSVVVGSVDLVPGNIYYLSIDNNYSGYRGSFMLYFDDQMDYDYFEGAKDVTSLINSCSGNAEYTTLGATSPVSETAPSCWNTGPDYTRWFKFVATKPAITIEVKRGGVYGTIRRINLALFEDDGTTLLDCNRYVFNDDNVEVGYEGLTVGDWYYIAVDNNYSGYRGTFTLCLDDNVSYDYYEGALELGIIHDWSSVDAAYTTIGATGDLLPASTWNTNPDYNRWFKFTATTNNIHLEVKRGGSYGTIRRINAAIWQANGVTEVASARYVNNDDNVIVQSMNLIPGNFYYISVDNNYSSYRGTFSLYLNDEVDYDFYEGARDITYLINSSSAPGEYTTLGATQDRVPPPPCWDTGPDYNRWFKFQASSPGISVTVRRGDIYGTIRRINAAIFESDGTTVLSCNRYINNDDVVEVSYEGLTTGNWYYIAVDNNYDGYRGTFTLELDDEVSYDFYEGAIELTDIHNWESDPAEYTTRGATSDRLPAPCWNTSPDFNRWFKFVATTSVISVEVKRGGVYGDIRRINAAIWESDGTTPVACNRYVGNDDNVSVGSKTLTPGNTYYISVDNNYAGYRGSFTLAVTDEMDYDFYEGAYEITDLNNWQSADAEFTTIGATSDLNPAACWNTSPDYNRWFKFQAISPDVTIQVLRGGSFGTIRRINAAIWEADGTTEIACSRYVGNDDNITINQSGLTVGNWYYIAVDNDYSGYRGTFTLAVNNVSSNEYWAIADDVWDNSNTWSYSEGGPPAGTTPSSGNIVHIGGYIVTVNAADVACAELIMEVKNNTTGLIVNGVELEVLGKTTITNPGNNIDGFIGVTGGGTLTVNDILEYNRNGGDNLLRLDISGNTSLVNVYQDLVLNSTAGSVSETQINLADASLLEVANNLRFNHTGGEKTILRSANSAVVRVLGDIEFIASAVDKVEMELLQTSSVELGRSFVRGTPAYGILDCQDNSTLVFNSADYLQVIPANAGEGTDGFTYQNIEINNTRITVPQISLEGDVILSGDLNLISGIVKTESGKLFTLTGGATLTGGGINSYIDGPFERIGNTSFVFPIGKNGLYQPVTISAPALLTDGFIAEYFNDDPDGLYSRSLKEVSLDNIADIEYWTIEKSAGNSNVNVTLEWDGDGSCIGDLVTLKVAAWDGSQWADLGNASTTGDLLNGTISSSGTLSHVINPVTFGNPYTATDFVGLAGPYCQDAVPVTLFGIPADANGIFTGPGISDNGNGTALFDPLAAGPGTHSITYTYTPPSGCGAAISKNVDIYPAPTASVNGTATICEGVPTDISIFFTGTAPWDVIYTDGTDIFNVVTSSNPLIISTSVPGTYEVTDLVDGNGCIGTVFGSKAIITDFAQPLKPVISVVTGVPDFCFGGSVTLEAPASDFYYWSNGSITQQNIITATGNYTVQLYNTFGCLSEVSDPFPVNVYDLPIPTLTSSDLDNSICAGELVTFSAGGGTLYEFFVNGGSVQGPLPSNTYPTTILNDGETVTVEVTNVNSCSALSAGITTAVTIDVVPPTITCPGDQVENPDVNCEVSLPDYTSLAIVTDNCDFAPVVTQSPVAGTIINTTTTVTLTATDIGGNSSNCTFDVTLDDIIPPVALCRDFDLTLDVSGNGIVIPADIDNGSTDNCSLGLMTVVPNAFTSADIGPNVVTLTVFDNNGNSATCNATVNVIDNTPPTAICQDITVYLDAAGSVTITGADIDGGSTDADGIASLSAVPNSFTCVNTGINSVVLTVTDNAGLSSNCNANVTVLDTISPVANCKNINIMLDPTGNASIVAADLDNGSNDNCGISNLSIDISSFTCADLGVVPVTLTVTDNSGNTSACQANVTVTTSLNIASASINSCDAIPGIAALFEASVVGGDDSYSYLWDGLNDLEDPFMEITLFPFSLVTSNTSNQETPLLNWFLPDGPHSVELTVTDGNGCTDSYILNFNKNGFTTDNITLIYSDACDGETVTYTVGYEVDATYAWDVQNGTIISAITDTNEIDVSWNLGGIEGIVRTNIIQPSVFGDCESSVIDTVTINPIPVPGLVGPNSVCQGSTGNVYSTEAGMSNYVWTVVGGFFNSGGLGTNNTATVTWNTLGNQSISVNYQLAGGCAAASPTVYNVTVNDNPAIALGTNPTVCSGTTIANLTYSATTGSPDRYNLVYNAAAIAAGFSDVTNAVLPASPINLVVPGAAPAATYTCDLTVMNSATMCVSGTYSINVIIIDNNTAILTSAATTDNQTVCLNTAITDITYATTGATGATVTGLPAGVTGSWAADVVTISGTPTNTAGSPYNYTVTLTGGCGVITANGTITVTPDNTVGAASSTPTLCINTVLTNITHATNGATGIGAAIGLPAGVTAAWAADVITISGTPTVDGIFDYSIPLTGGCGAVNATGTITVTPDNTVGAASSTPTLCINTVLTNITHATTGATGIGAAIGLPAGVTAAWAADVITISGTPTADGIFNYSIPLTGGCGAVNATGTITVTPDNTISLLSAPGTINQTVCANSAINNITYITSGATGASFSGLPAGVTGTWAANLVSISGTPTVSGTFNYTVTLTGGCGIVTALGSITSSPTNTITLSSAAGTDNQTVCINTVITDISYTTTGETGAVFTGLPAGVTGSWAAGIATISGTPTVSGNFNYTVILTGGCGFVIGSGNISVTPDNTISLSSGTGSDNQTVCNNIAISNITYTTSGATGATFANLPAGVSGNWAGNTVTISGTPTVSGIFNYTVTLTGGCGVVTALGTITSLSDNTITLSSAIGTDNQSICINTAITDIIYTTTGATGANFTGLPTGMTVSWAANKVTISGTPTTSGVYSYTINLTGGCGNVSAFGTITVVPVNTISLSSAAGTDGQTLCINNPITDITYASTEATGVAVTGLPAGVSGIWAADVVTISGTPTESGIFNYTVTLTGGCGVITAPGTITVTPDIVITLTSAAGTDNQNICINTAAADITYSTTGATGATVSGLPAGVTGIWAADVVTISGTPTASGTFNYTVTLTGGCGVITAPGTITVAPDNTVALSSAAGTDNQTLCINTAITDITYNTTGATGATVTGLPAGVTGIWAADVVTISGTPTASGTFNYTVTLTGGCNVITAPGTITVTPDNVITLTSAAGTDNQNICINTAVTDITYSTTGATGATVSGLPAGVTGVWAADVFTINGTPTESGIFNYTVTLTGGCGVITAPGTITVAPDNTVALSSAAGTDNQNICINTAATDITYSTTGATGATVSGLPAGVTGIWAADVVTISGTPTASGTFNYTVTLTGGCGVITAPGTITVAPDNTVALSSAAGTDNQTLCINTAITDITYNTTGATGAAVTGLPAGLTGIWAADVVTISGTPTASGTFNYTVTLTGGCNVITAPGTITVTPDNVITLTSVAGTDNQTLCINTAITDITYSTTGATGATVSGLPAGVTGIWAADVFTISGTPTASGTFNYIITLTGGCGVVTAPGTITVSSDNTVLLISAAGTDNQAICINTAISDVSYLTSGATGATVTGLPAGVTGVWAADVVTISGTPTASGTFNYTVTLTGGCGVVTAPGTITVTPDNTIALSSAAGTDNQTVCINTVITDVTYSTTRATGANFAGLPAGVSGSWAADLVTISGTPTVSGNFNYTIILTGGCGLATANGIISVTPDNTVLLSSAAGTDNQTVCNNTIITDITYGTTGATGATVTGLPAGVTGVWSADAVTISGTPTESGTFNYTVTLTGGCGVVTALGSITSSPDNTIALSSAAGTDNPTVCISTAITDITYTTTGATGATFTGLPAGMTVNFAANTVTISGSPTTSGIYPYTINLTGGCGNVSAVGTITVVPVNTISLSSAAGTDGQTLCINNTITDITYASTEATGATVTGLPTGVTGSWAADVVTISGTPTASGIFNYTVTLTGGCGVITAPGTITVTPDNVITLTSAAGTDNQNICINTAATDITYSTTGATDATVSGLPAGVTGVWAADLVTISGTPTESGIFNYTVTLTGGCGIITAPGTITVTPDNTITLSSAAGTDNQTACLNTVITDITYSTISATGATVTGLPVGVTGIWAADVVTISGTPTVSGIYNYTVTLTGGCGVATTPGTITVVTDNTIALSSATGTDNQTLCTNTAITDITYSTTTATDATVTGLPAGVTGLWAADLVTISGTPTESGIFNYTVTLTGGCGIITAPGTITVTPDNTITLSSAADTDNQTVCLNTVITDITYSTISATGAAVTGLPAGLTGIWAADVVTVSGTPTVTGTFNYTITLTGGCGIVTENGTITINPTPTVSSTQIDVLCFGSSTGSIDIKVSDGLVPYTFAWTGTGVDATSEDQSGLAAGAYSVIATDANGCASASLPVTITEPASAVSGSISSQTDVSVFGGNDGEVTVAGSGGTSPYLYALDAGTYQASGTFSTLTAGSYIVTIQDINLCAFDVPVTITQPAETLSGSIISQTDVACFGISTGSVTVEGSGGVAPYEYSMDAGSYQSSSTFPGLAAGTYTVTIQDVALTTFDVIVTIAQPASPLGGLITSQNDVLCFGSSTGSVTISGSGGTSPYQYKLESGAYQASGIFDSMAAGDYTVTVQDANLCIIDMPVTITQPALEFTGSISAQTDVSCFGSTNGSVTVTGSGGTAPYDYSLDGGTYQMSGIFNDLAASSYIVTVRDANLCTTDVTVNISEPQALSIAYTTNDASCPGTTDGSISLTLTGGTQPYSTLWSDGTETIDRVNIPDGNYSVVVTDLNGCGASQDVTVGVIGLGNCLVIPDIITPNNDGYNDTWIINNIDLFPNAEVFVYSRWGKRVYKTKNISANPWDGKLNGKILPTDSYHYILHLNDGSEPRSGVISIIR